MEQAVARPIRILVTLAAILTAANVYGYRSFPGHTSHSALAERLIDVNHASEVDLQLIPGIGPSIARRICSQRLLRPFENANDFESRVKGVGPSFMLNYGSWLTYGNSAEWKDERSNLNQVMTQ